MRRRVGALVLPPVMAVAGPATPERFGGFHVGGREVVVSGRAALQRRGGSSDTPRIAGMREPP